MTQYLIPPKTSNAFISETEGCVVAAGTVLDDGSKPSRYVEVVPTSGLRLVTSPSTGQALACAADEGPLKVGEGVF